MRCGRRRRSKLFSSSPSVGEVELGRRCSRVSRDDALQGETFAFQSRSSPRSCFDRFVTFAIAIATPALPRSRLERAEGAARETKCFPRTTHRATHARLTDTTASTLR